MIRFTWVIHGHEMVEIDSQNKKETGWRRSLVGNGPEYKYPSDGCKKRQERPRTSRLNARMLEFLGRL